MVAASLSWRILVVVAVLVVVGLAISRLRLIFVPAFVAAIGAAFLGPPSRRLRALVCPRAWRRPPRCWRRSSSSAA